MFSVCQVYDYWFVSHSWDPIIVSAIWHQKSLMSYTDARETNMYGRFSFMVKIKSFHTINNTVFPKIHSAHKKYKGSDLLLAKAFRKFEKNGLGFHYRFG